MARGSGGDVPSLVREAERLVLGGAYDRALDLYDEALRIRRVPRIMCDKARCLAKTGRVQEALDLCKTAYDKNMRDPYIPYVTAAILSAEGRDGDAAKWYRRAQNLGPEDPVILAGLARFHSRSGNPKAASDYYVRSYERQGNPVSLRDIAGELLKAGDPVEAKKFCNMAIDANPGDPLLRPLATKISSEIGDPCKETGSDARFIRVPDTNWWIRHYLARKGRSMTDNEMAVDKAAMIRDIKSGRLVIFQVIVDEFYGRMNEMISAEEDLGNGSEHLRRALDAFLAICREGKIDGRPIEERQPEMYKRANLVYREIWGYKSKYAMSAKMRWARIKSKITAKAWNKMSQSKKNRLVPENPPRDTNDHRILAEAGSLANTGGRKTVVVITGDHDLIPFKIWIWRRLGVCIRESYGTKPK